MFKTYLICITNISKSILGWNLGNLGCLLDCVYRLMILIGKGEQGTAKLGINTVLKQTNEPRFYRQKLPSPIVIGLAQQVLT